MNTATAEPLQPGDRVVWRTNIHWRTFHRMYDSPVCYVVAVSKNTVHIRIKRSCGRTTLKWVKRSRITLCVIQDNHAAAWHAAALQGIGA